MLNIDVIHVEKNVCQNVLNYLLYRGKNAKKKFCVRRDLQAMGIKSAFHPQVDVERKKVCLPPPAFLVSKKDRILFFEFLKKKKRFQTGMHLINQKL